MWCVCVREKRWRETTFDWWIGCAVWRQSRRNWWIYIDIKCHVTQMVNLLGLREKTTPLVWIRCMCKLSFSCKSGDQQLSVISNQFSSSKKQVFCSKNPTFKNRKHLSDWYHRNFVVNSFVFYCVNEKVKFINSIKCNGNQKEKNSIYTNFCLTAHRFFLLGLVYRSLSCLNGCAMVETRMNAKRKRKTCD